MSTMILKGFCHGGEVDSLLLKNFLASGGDSARRGEGTRGDAAPSSLLPAHVSAAIDTDEWLADKSRAATARAAVNPGRPNIMAPVLKSTSAEYWLDREGRPPVNERGGELTFVFAVIFDSINY